MKSDLPHGWDYGDVINLARITAATYRFGGSAIGHDEAYLAAYDGMVAHLYNTDEPPSRRELYVVGARAISGRIIASYRDVGRPVVGTGARFRTYWMGDRQTEPDHGPRAVENLAIWQVFEALDEEDRETLTQVAHHLNVQDVMKATGWGASQYTRRLKKARENFYALWYEGNTPPAIPRLVRVTIPRQKFTPYSERGYVYPKENKSGTRYRARYRRNGRTTGIGVYDTETEAWRAIDQHRAKLVALDALDQFEADHRAEQPAESSPLRTQVGDAAQHRMAVSEAS